MSPGGGSCEDGSLGDAACWLESCGDPWTSWPWVSAGWLFPESYLSCLIFFMCPW